MRDTTDLLTICLVSRGRDDYLRECLESLEQFSNDPQVYFLIIDNGAGPFSSNLLKEFVNRDTMKRELIQKTINDPRPSAFWLELQKRKIGWALFPSDDDILLPNAVELWKSTLSSSTELVAIGASAMVIDSSSKSSGVRIEPTIADEDDPVLCLANCFYEPPFVWPALFIYVPALPDELCHSRYAFDWWISLNLLASERVQISKSIILKYRVHNEQESSLAPKRRKYFEATLWISRFASSETFKDWVENLTDSEILKFWKALTEKSPIYGFEEFGKVILFNIAEILLKHTQDREIASLILSDLTQRFSIFLKIDEAWHMSDRLESMSWESNVNLVPQDDVCPKLLEASLQFSSSLNMLRITVGCLHSTKNASTTILNCDLLRHNNPKLNADQLISQVTEMHEKYYRIMPSFILKMAKRSKGKKLNRSN